MCDLPDDETTWHLTIESFVGISIAARHVYGRIHQPDARTRVTYPQTPDEERMYSSVNVVRSVTAEVAAGLSEPGWVHPVGGTTKRFDDRATLIAAAVEQWRELPARRGVTHARLVLGHPAYSEDHPVLDALGHEEAPADA